MSDKNSTPIRSDKRLRSLGLVSISFRNNTPQEILSAAKDAGLDCIEWGSDVHAPFDNTDRIRSIAAMQAEYGIYCSSYGSYYRIGASPESDLTKIINAAKILGTDVVRLWAGTLGSEAFGADDKALLFEECRKVAEIGRENGIVFCTECHIGTFTDTKSSALELMENVCSPNFRTYWQPNQFLSDEDNIEFARAMSPYAVHIHVFNWCGKKRYPLGESIDLWRQYLSNFGKTNTLLLEFMPDDMISTLKCEAESLRKVADK